MQLKILEIMFNNQPGHLVYMRDVTAFVKRQETSDEDVISLLSPSPQQLGTQNDIPASVLQIVTEALLRSPSKGLKVFCDRIKSEIGAISYNQKKQFVGPLKSIRNNMLRVENFIVQKCQ